MHHIFICIYRDGFHEPDKALAIYSIDEPDSPPTNNAKGKLPTAKTTHYETYIDLLDCPSPQPSDTGSDVVGSDTDTDKTTPMQQIGR